MDKSQRFERQTRVLLLVCGLALGFIARDVFVGRPAKADFVNSEEQRILRALETMATSLKEISRECKQ